METQLLNEYIFASLVAEQAQIARRHRLNALESSGATPEEIIKVSDLNQADLKKGFESLAWYRAEVLELLQRQQN